MTNLLAIKTQDFLARASGDRQPHREARAVEKHIKLSAVSYAHGPKLT